MNAPSPTPTEIAKCPNPECGKPCETDEFDSTHWVWCRTCKYCGPETTLGESEAIRLHNALCAPALAPFEKLREMTMADDVPSGYSPEGQYAWKAGWNACVGYITGKRELPQDVADRLSAVVEEVRGKP